MILERQTKLEFRPIRLGPTIDLGKARAEGALLGQVNAQGITLTSQLHRFLELMSDNQTLYNIAMYHFNKGIRMSFSGLRQLLVFMVEENHIDDNVFKEQFTSQRESLDLKGVIDKLKVKVAGQELAVDKADVQRQVSELPFFRSLNFDLLDLFFTHSKITVAPAKIAICSAGQTNRTLNVLLTGAASVYQKTAAKQKRKTATLRPGAIFGETGFFLGEPYLDDIITEEDSLIMQVKYKPEVFDSIFQEAQSREMSNRLWLVQALLQSQMFRAIPSDNFHEVVVSGELKKFPTGHTMYKEGDKATTCYILVKGTMDVTRKGQSLTKLNPGEIFGETGLLVNSGKCAETIVTETEALALEIPDRQFYELLASNFTLALELEKIAMIRNKT